MRSKKRETEEEKSKQVYVNVITAWRSMLIAQSHAFS